MEKNETALHEAEEQPVEFARRVMENYFQFFQGNLSAAPWTGSEFPKKMAGYMQQNVTAIFDFAQQLAKAEDLADVLSIQAAFFQYQLRSLTKQAKEFAETVTKSASGGLKEGLETRDTTGS